MTLYTDFDTEYFHLCNGPHDRISWCYRKYSSSNELLCSYRDCSFKFSTILIFNTNAYNIFKSRSYLYVNFKSGTNNKGYLETLQKIEI